VTTEEIKRSQMMRAFNLGDTNLLISCLDDLGGIPDLELLREPETGLIMVRGRLGGTGAPFNLGEMLVTRCTVTLEGHIGHGFKLGDDPQGAFLAAAADAMSQCEFLSQSLEEIASILENDLKQRTKLEALETSQTKVDFFTLVRGEDNAS
jgi:alpha-D-ribose 1-methylphosphonate 5-triphosphate synthase subunit PhnG